MHAVVHEPMHVGGAFKESVAECSAMHHDAEVARYLGASPADAEAAAERHS